MISPLPPERLRVELGSLVGQELSRRGFLLVTQGPSGLVWKRSISAGKVLGILALIAFGALLPFNDTTALVMTLVAWALALWLALRSFPAKVRLDLAQAPGGGTKISLSGGPQTIRIRPLVKRTAQAR